MVRFVLSLTIWVTLCVYARCQITNAQCPLPSAIEPCDCYKPCPACPAVFRCAKIHGLDDLKEVFEKGDDVPFTNLEIIDSEGPHIPGESIDKKRVERLYLVNSSFETIFDQSPPEANVLETLILENVNLLRGLDWAKFSKLYHLLELYVSDTDVRKIENSFGEIMPKSIRVLHFYETRMRTLGNEAFALLKNLQSLGVRKSRLQKLERSMLPKPFIGTLLDFSGNQLQNFPKDFFSEMPNLNTLLLANNEFTSVSMEYFGKLPAQLRVIFLRNNPLQCDCDMKWILSKKMPYLEGKCVGPNTVKDKRIRELKQPDFPRCK